MKKELPHEGHRERLKNRFLTSSLDNFEPHNILELLLFYSIPRQDTNEIAHALLDRFGSLKGVFDADFSELIKIKGIKENSATLIKLIPQISRAYMFEEINKEKIFDHIDKVGSYFVNKYIGETNEVVYIMLLDNQFQLLKVVKLHEGSVNSSYITPRKIMDEVVKANAATVILAHNHPNGLLVPSSEDCDTTNMLSCSLKMFDVTLLEHILVAGDRFLPLAHELSLVQHFDSQRLKY